MKVNILRFILALTLIVLLSCASTRSTGDKSEEGPTAPRSAVQASAIVFENENLSWQLADMFYENDLDFSGQITLEDTKAFTESADAVYQLEKEFGIFIQDAL